MNNQYFYVSAYVLGKFIGEVLESLGIKKVDSFLVNR